MRRFRRYVVPVLMVLSLSFLAGSDSECEIEDIDLGGWGHYWDGGEDVIIVDDCGYWCW